MPIASSLENIRVDSNISLEMINGKHADGLFSLVEKNRSHLRSWLPWVDNMQTPDAAKAYINLCNRQHDEGTDYGYMILFNEQAVGRIGIHYIHKHNKSGSIGYWVSKDFTGQGIVTKACIALIKFAFVQLRLHRIEIKCATGNQKSAAIAEKLHFKKEGILRQAEYVNGQYLDLFLFSMLAEEWQANQDLAFAQL